MPEHSRRFSRFAGWFLRFLPGGVALVLAVCLGWGVVRWVGLPGGYLLVSAQNLTEKYRMYIHNRLGEALEGIFSLDRVYWIGRDEAAAPVPDRSRYSRVTAGELGNIAQEAAGLLDGQTLFFPEATHVEPQTPVTVYRDETILALTWKQKLDGGMYTFSEIKIAHPSQFRRFLAGGSFGSEALHITTEMAKSVNAVVASSGDFYSYRQMGTIVYGGAVRRVNAGLVDTCCIDTNGDLIFCPRENRMDAEQAQEYVNQNNIEFSLAFGPILIEDGKTELPDSYPIGEIFDRFPRSALCQLGKLHYLLAVVNAEGDAQRTPTLGEFARELRQAGVERAYTLDGGQTAVIAMDGQLINAVLFGYQRRISDIIYFATAIPGGQEDAS